MAFQADDEDPWAEYDGVSQQDDGVPNNDEEIWDVLPAGGGDEECEHHVQRRR